MNWLVGRAARAKGFKHEVGVFKTPKKARAARPTVPVEILSTHTKALHLASLIRKFKPQQEISLIVIESEVNKATSFPRSGARLYT